MGGWTGAQALLDALIAHGTRYLFGIPGVHTLPLYDALAGRPELKPIVTRHEAGATFAADGYARVSGRPGVVSVVPGPGALNAATGVLCAWSDRVPMIVLTAELDPSDRQAAVHEGDLEAAYRPFTKAQMRIWSRADIELIICRAFAEAMHPPAGPVQVLVPLRVLTEQGQRVDIAMQPQEETTPADGAAIQVLSFLQTCQSPTLILGMGVAAAGAEALDLVERLGAPTFTDVRCRGLIPEDHPLSAGLLPWERARAVLAASDGMLILGSRLSEISTLNWDVELPRNLVRVDADPSQLQGNYPAVLAIQADPLAILRRLLALQPPGRTRAPNAAVRALARAREAPTGSDEGSSTGRIHPRAAVRELRAALPRDAIVVTDATATEFWLSEESFPILEPRGFLLPEVQQTMGYALAASVGAGLAVAEMGTHRPVVCISGDGSFQMMLGELATAAGLGRQLTVVIFEDGYYNALRIYQDGRYGRQLGVKLNNPDFVALVRAYGAQAERVEDVALLRPAVERALSRRGLGLVCVAIDAMPLPDRYARRLEQMALVG